MSLHALGEHTLENDSFYHIHDYCDIWRKEIPSSYSIDKLDEEEVAPCFDDIETGVAYCWCFENNGTHNFEKYVEKRKESEKNV